MDIKTYKFLISADDNLIKNFIKRYHFDEKDIGLVGAVAVFVGEIIRVTSTICYEEQRVICAATLGEQYDTLVDMAEESGNLLLSYCLECFGMELLSKSYERINEKVYADTGKWLGVYRFLDMDSLEISEQESTAAEDKDGGVFQAVLDAGGISWRKGMLHPLKSVLFTAEYKRDKGENGCYSCEQCDSLTCSFRQNIRDKAEGAAEISQMPKNIYSYGISRILENRRE